jgi:large subunit ribosomal protein L24
VPAMKIKKGDTVQVITGKDKGKQGRVLESRPSVGKVVVENIAVVKRHQRPRPVQGGGAMGSQIIPGGIIEKPAAIDVSNVQLVCPVCKKPTRVGMTVREIKGEQIKLRVCKKCNEEIDKGDRR